MHRITNIRLPSPFGKSAEKNLWWVLLDDHGIILAINSISTGSAISGDDWKGDFLSPMGVDLQINGGLGLAFTELNFDSIPKLFDLLDRLWLDGVEAICPTFVSTNLTSLKLGLKVLRHAREQHCLNRCELLGAHIEGPFLENSKRGAHLAEHLVPPTLTALAQLISGCEDEIALFTLAPELPGSSEVIKKLKSLGIVVCLGHSAADENICRGAFEDGVSMLTHTFNAMPGLLHREPGPIGEALKHGSIAMGLIADGEHVHPTIAFLLQRLAPNKLVLVSDAIAPYGLSEGSYEWDNRIIQSRKGACRLEDGTLVGTSLPLLEGSIRLTKWGQNSSSSIWASTIAPRLVLEPDKVLVDHFIGKSLDQLLRWHMNSDLNQLTWHKAA